ASLVTLATDTSGKNCNWQAFNFSVAADFTNDSLTDTPTNNFAVLGPLGAFAPLDAGMSCTQGPAAWNACGSMVNTRTGKWFAESGFNNVAGGTRYAGIGLRFGNGSYYIAT